MRLFCCLSQHVVVAAPSRSGPSRFSTVMARLWTVAFRLPTGALQFATALPGSSIVFVAVLIPKTPAVD
jgi:hypothetical protein